VAPDVAQFVGQQRFQQLRRHACHERGRHEHDGPPAAGRDRARQAVDDAQAHAAVDAAAGGQLGQSGLPDALLIAACLCRSAPSEGCMSDPHQPQRHAQPERRRAGGPRADDPVEMPLQPGEEADGVVQHGCRCLRQRQHARGCHVAAVQQHRHEVGGRPGKAQQQGQARHGIAAFRPRIAQRDQQHGRRTTDQRALPHEVQQRPSEAGHEAARQRGEQRGQQRGQHVRQVRGQRRERVRRQQYGQQPVDEPGVHCPSPSFSSCSISSRSFFEMPLLSAASTSALADPAKARCIRSFSRFVCSDSCAWAGAYT